MAVKTTYTVSPQAQSAADYLREAMQTQLAANEQRRAANELAYRNQAPTVERQFDDVAQSAYASLLSNERAAANQLASSGLYNSGYADSYRIAQQNAYGASLNAAQLSRDDALRNIENQILAGNQQYGASANEIQSAYQQLIADQTWRDEQARVAAEQQALANAYTAADAGDFRQLQALGVDTRGMETAYRQQQALVAEQVKNAKYSRTSATQAATATATAAKEAAAKNAEEEYQTILQTMLSASGGDPTKALAWLISTEKSYSADEKKRLRAVIDDLTKNPGLYDAYLQTVTPSTTPYSAVLGPQAGVDYSTGRANPYYYTPGGRHIVSKF